MFSKPMQTAAAVLAVSIMNVASAQEVHSAEGSQYGIQQAQGVVETPTRPGTYVPGQQYPQLNAPLYPSPVQYTPAWNGGSVITNQALAPHEMLYPHTYHAMYPPFYHKVKGGWFWTPFGFRQHEHWELQGTEVKVKYRSHYPLFGGFHPPVSHHSVSHH